MYVCLYVYLYVSLALTLTYRFHSHTDLPRSHTDVAKIAAELKKFDDIDTPATGALPSVSLLHPVLISHSLSLSLTHSLSLSLSLSRSLSLSHSHSLTHILSLSLSLTQYQRACSKQACTSSLSLLPTLFEPATRPHRRFSQYYLNVNSVLAKY